MTRIVARVFFLNNIESYFSFINTLSESADMTLHISDVRFCKGEDTVPDLRPLIELLDENSDKNILITNIAEYLRIGQLTEKNASYIYSILNRHVHSNKRVWIPIFLGEGLFNDVVGRLDEERFNGYIFEIIDNPTAFETTVYSKVFAKQSGIVNANGIREWLSLWDNQQVKTGMSFATKQLKQISQSNSDYTLHIISDPFEYIISCLNDDVSKMDKSLGTDEEWSSLVPVIAHGDSIDRLITRALNMVSFDPISIISSWREKSDIEKWLFYLWYRLDLNNSSDYLSFAVSKSINNGNLLFCIESSILDCTDNVVLDEWIEQRNMLLKRIGYSNLSVEFGNKLDEISDTRLKLKLLTGNTIEEKARIIEIVSSALREGKQVNDFKTILYDKYPDLIKYLIKNEYLSGDINQYITQYKHQKIADQYSVDLSNQATQIDCLQFDTRGSILFALKNSISQPFFIWFDGFGIEWIDLLLDKIQQIDSSIAKPTVNIGTAVLPTVTSVNMSKADPATISLKKIDSLDSLSHIKDKSNCNYSYIVAKQFEMITEFATIIVNYINSNPGKEVIVTADHGMSRMAALGFHSTQGVNSPKGSSVYNHGRYCELSDEDSTINISNTKKDGKIVAFCSHNHFTSPGYAPGEIHGGATPEELLVPIIRFSAKRIKNAAPKTIPYSIESSNVYLDGNGMISLSIFTQDNADSLSIDINGSLFSAISNDKNHWIVKIPGLQTDHNYKVQIYPNNIVNSESHIITVKRKGLIVDDDF